MNEGVWALTKATLDEEIDKLPPDEPVGIKLGWGLYSYLRDNGLLAPKEADLLLWKWVIPSYRGFFVYDSPDIGDAEFKIGTRNA